MILLRDVIRQRLASMGADGLCNSYQGCSCSIDNLGQYCDNPSLDFCEAAKTIIDDMGSHLLPYRDTVFLLCLWNRYQRSGSLEDMTRWLKHRAYKKASGGCRK